MRWWLLAVIGFFNAGNALGQDAAPVCNLSQGPFQLASDVRETSGLARGHKNPDILWTHNDSGNQPELFGLGPDGSVRARVRILNARSTDWEDVAAGPCGADHCLYIADIGDNFGKREFITIYELSEPAATANEATVARVINAGYPDGPQDAEALFILPNGDIYIVTKGRQKAIKLYRLTAATANDRRALELIREVAPKPADELDRVTSATSSPNGEWVAIRTYRTLYLYRTKELLEEAAPVWKYSLTALREKQGEAVTLDNEGRVWLSSEAENKKDMPTLLQVACTLQ